MFSVHEAWVDGYGGQAVTQEAGPPHHIVKVIHRKGQANTHGCGAKGVPRMLLRSTVNCLRDSSYWFFFKFYS